MAGVPGELVAPGATRCGAPTKATGAPCTNPRQVGRPTCISHDEDPHVRAKMRAASARGGRAKKGADADAQEIVEALQAARTPGDVRTVLARVAGLVLAGKVQPRVGATVAQLAGQVLRACADDLEKELEEVRALLEKHPAVEVQAWARRRRSR